MWYCHTGFPHSEICGSKLICSSPQLIAACHVLHRLLLPRHSPCALFRLTFVAPAVTTLRSRLRRKLRCVATSLLSSLKQPNGLVSRREKRKSSRCFAALWFSRIMQAHKEVCLPAAGAASGQNCMCHVSFPKKTG